MNIKPLVAATLSTVLAVSSIQSFASEKSHINKNERSAGNKGAALFTTGVLVGAIAGGPIGAIVGAVGGAFIGEDLKQGARAEDNLQEAENQIVNYKSQLKETENQVAQLQDARAKRLEFQVLFTTGDDSLSHQDIQRINSLALYLKKNPELKIRLDGYADPRGEDDYNNTLSEDRAVAVVNALDARGIDKSRITYSAHGAKLSTAYQGDLEAYALERRVKIEVYANEESVAAN